MPHRQIVVGFLFFLVPLLWLPHVSAGGTACISKQLDWYTDVVGETPCTLLIPAHYRHSAHEHWLNMQA